nr:hypothetical protein [Pirellula sp.]
MPERSCRVVALAAPGVPAESARAKPTTRSDEDYFAMDLRKGDILDTRLVGVPGTRPTLALLDASSQELHFAQGRFLGGTAFPPSSPLYKDGLTTLPYVIATSGRYYLRVADGIGSYVLNLRVQRSTFEAEPIGTQQTLYIDFDGALTRAETLNLTDTMARVEQKLRTSLAARSNNGFYGATGNPGEFNVRLVSSFDSPDLWGQTNVSRVLVGGTQTEIGLDPASGLLGIAQSVDVGNFSREESGLVMVDILIADSMDPALVPIAGN